MIKAKTIFCLTLVWSGGLLAGCANEPTANPSPSKTTGQRQVFPPIEDVRTFFSSGSNEWYGHSFREIISPPQVKGIILLEDKDLQNPYLPKSSPQQIQDNYNTLFDHLELSDQKAVDPFVAAFEGDSPQFAILTTSGDVIYLEACGGTGMLIFGHGIIGTRINITGFGRPSGAAKPPLNTTHSLPSVEVNYVLDQKPDHWAGRRFGQIIQPNKIKRIALLWEDMTMFGHFVETPEVHNRLLRLYGYDTANRPPPSVAAEVEKQEHQIGYGKLLDRFETSDQKGEMIHLAENEAVLAKLIFLTDSGRVIYMEIVGVIDDHITGVLIHGPGEGVRINLTVLPPASDAKRAEQMTK